MAAFRLAMAPGAPSFVYSLKFGAHGRSRAGGGTMQRPDMQKSQQDGSFGVVIGTVNRIEWLIGA